MSTWSATLRDNKSPTPPASPHDATHFPRKPEAGEPYQPSSGLADISTLPPPPSSFSVPSSPINAEHAHAAHAAHPDLSQSPPSSPHGGRQRSNSRPLSMVQSWAPPVMDVTEDTIPELQPIFTFLNSNANKLYQEGYFLKLDDQNSQGRPNADRTWTECFAQLVGTVLSLWDAAELDAAGENREVLPKFINLTDASIKMIESLPTKSNDEQPLQNILSISTAGRNRYLLHFNSHHSLIQWTAGIRLAMFEQSTLQEAYTGALIAGKGKKLNNINLIMDRTRVRTEAWVRVRFGAGVPWRRCWCVINPPDEKEYQKLQKDLKKRSAYDRSAVPILKGDIKFYDVKKEGKKLKKAKPIATIEEAYSAYAIYPQSKALIEASTLIKIEGNITIHSDPPSATEGFVFVMPEVSPAVTGFEMLLRFLFPTWDVFGLYGRPGRLVASVLDPRSLMFGMPKHRRYGYLEILDVTSIILADGSAGWSEREWRRKLKELTGSRMTAMDENGEPGVRSHSRSASRGSKRLSIGPGAAPVPARTRVNFADDNAGSVRNSRSMSLSRPGTRTDSAPPTERLRAGSIGSGHARNASDTGPLPLHDSPTQMMAEPPLYRRNSPPNRGMVPELASTPERHSSEEETPPQDLEAFQRMHTPEPVQPPPAFAHAPSSKPTGRPYHSPEMRRANSRLSSTTLAQLAKASGVSPAYDPDHNMGPGPSPNQGQYQDPRGPHAVQHPHANPPGMTANPSGLREVLNASPHNPTAPHQSPGLPPPQAFGNNQFRALPNHAATGPQFNAYSPSSSFTSDRQFETPDMGGGPGPAIHHDPTVAPGSAQYTRRGHSPGGQPHIMQDPNRGPPPPQQGPLPFRGPSSGISGGPPGSYPHQAGRGRGNIQAYGPPQNYGPPRQGPHSQGRRTPPPGAGRGGPPFDPHVSPPRKPLPARTTSLAQQSDDGSRSRSSSLQRQGESGGTAQSSISSRNNSLRDLVLDETAFAQIGVESRPSPAPEQQYQRQQVQRQQTQRSMASSNYDDASSTTSPDYASTRKSSETQDSVDRPRAGVLRTVGDAAQPPVPKRPDEYNVPTFDFGPTLNYGAANAPRNKTPTPLGGPSETKTPPRSYSPGPGRAYSPGPGASYFSAPSARRSPAVSPGEQTRPAEVAHIRQESHDTLRRSVAWQPGAVSIGSGAAERAGAVTPEQFVQQRAASGSTSPFYAHQRNPSNNTLAAMRGNTPTPTLLRRTSSYDMLNKVGGHSRSSSTDLLGQRPGSQGASGALAQGGAGDISSHLSAREQEHLARVTGTPLISMAGHSKNASQGGSGLVGAIAAREQEKQQMKDGIRSHTMQNAINARQMQQQDQYRQQQQHQQQYMQSQMGAPSMGAPSVFGGSMGVQSNMMGGGYGYQLPPGHGPPGQQHYNSPSTGYAQSAAGWNPGPRQGIPQQVDPGFIPSPQQGFMPTQYTPTSPPSAQQPQRPNTPGSMGRAYHGQAF